MNVLNWVGVGFQLLGSLAVALGLYDTLKAFRQRGGQWHFQDRLSVWWNAIRKHVLRKQPKPNRGVAISTLPRPSGAAAGYSPIRLPDITTDPAAFATQVEASLNHLLGRAVAAVAATEQEGRKREAAIETVRAVIERSNSALDEQIQEVEVGGLRLEAIGLLFVVIGTILSAVP
jgi:hypothetical protein